MQKINGKIDWFAPSSSPEQRARQREIDDRVGACMLAEHNTIMEQLYPGSYPEYRRPSLRQKIRNFFN